MLLRGRRESEPSCKRVRRKTNLEGLAIVMNLEGRLLDLKQLSRHEDRPSGGLLSSLQYIRRNYHLHHEV